MIIKNKSGDVIFDGDNLQGANLTGASLAGANLVGADLRNASLAGANLVGADLRNANLRGVDLACAYLTGTNLTGADLRDADLFMADLTCADLTGVIGYTKLPEPNETVEPRPTLRHDFATITVCEGIATFEDDTTVEATAEQIKALPRLIHQFKHLHNYINQPGDFFPGDVNAMLAAGDALRSELWPEGDEEQ